jgi:hypothetical protein
MDAGGIQSRGVTEPQRDQGQSPSFSSLPYKPQFTSKKEEPDTKLGVGSSRPHVLYQKTGM